MSTNPAMAEPQEEDLDRAIEELRGVLHEVKGCGRVPSLPARRMPT